jgi:uncharacterized protein involved in response to NO
MITISEPSPKPGSDTKDFALFNLGFRPFYLLASVFAASSILLWIAQYGGYLPAAYLRDPSWHGHEMLFGYTIAVIAGFLFTAVRSWANQPTPAGAPLALYAGLWLAGRVLVLTPYDMASAVVNAAFPLAVAFGIGLPLWRGRNQRNYFFVALMVLLAIATLVMHLSHMGLVPWLGVSLQTGLDLVLFIIVVIAGRVLPMFTNNGVPGSNAMRHALVEKLALSGVLALLVLDLIQAPAILIAILCAAAAAAHAVRLALWKPWRTLRTPLLWILHASYAWAVVYLGLRGLSALGVVTHVVAVHALTIGVIGGMTIGMMTRTTRGHTGRPLKADAFDTTCYLLVMLAAAVRVFGGVLFAQHYVLTVIVSGLCWSSAFALYAVRYWPALSRPRLDGKPG